MKFDFKKAAQAAKKHLKPTTMAFALAAAGMAYGGTQAYTYYKDSPEKAAYTQCIDEMKPCTKEQLTLTKTHVLDGARATVWLIIPQFWFLMGLGYRKEEKHKEKQRQLSDQKFEVYEKYVEQRMRAAGLSDELAQTQAKLAPYLAEEQRKADVAANTAAKQQLNDMAQDATTLQGEIKVAKKITIKQTPPKP